MILDAAPFPEATSIDPARLSHRLAVSLSPDGRSLILGDGADLHRVWLRCERIDAPLAALIPFDDWTDVRLQAASSFCQWIAGAAPAARPPVRPTAYQAQRLHQLLAILDLRREAPLITSHEIARRIVYPRLALGRGAAWKASTERRRTQRLIREAEALVAGGYRAFLAGRMGRQK